MLLGRKNGIYQTIYVVGYPRLIHYAALQSSSLEHLLHILWFLGVSRIAVWFGAHDFMRI